MTTKPRAIDVTTTPTADRPIVPTAKDIKIPGPLPRNLAATVTSPFPFYLLAIVHSPESWFAALFFGGLTALEFVYVTPMLHPMLATFATLTAITVAVTIVFTVAIRTATENAIVIYKEGERTEVDLEWKIWRHSQGRRWSDTWRWPVEDKHGVPQRRVLVIDAQDYDFATPQGLYKETKAIKAPDAATTEGNGAARTVVAQEPLLRPFLPFLAPLPVRPAGLDPSIPVHAPSQAELGMTHAVGLAVRGWLNTKSPTAELMSIAILSLLIGAAFLLIFMGGNQITETLATTQKAASSEEVNAAVQAEIERRFAQEGFLVVPHTPVPVIQPAPSQ